MKNTLNKQAKIAIFQKKEIRRAFYKDEWWFSMGYSMYKRPVV